MKPRVIAASSLRWSYVTMHALSGLYAGACLSIAAVDLRFVRSLSSADAKREAFRALLEAMGRLMLPQLLLLSACALLLWLGQRSRPSRWLPVALLAAIWAVTALVHIPINLRFVNGLVRDAEVVALVARWDAFHLLRTALALALPWTVVRAFGPRALGHRVGESGALLDAPLA